MLKRTEGLACCPKSHFTVSFYSTRKFVSNATVRESTCTFLKKEIYEEYENFEEDKLIKVMLL